MMKNLTFLLLLIVSSTTTADLNGFKPIYVPQQATDRQSISYTTNVHHPDPDPNHPDHHGAQSTIDVTFGNPSQQQQQQPQESRAITNVFNKDYYIPPKTIETYQKPLQYQNGVLTAKDPDSQLFNVGYSVSFANAKKNLKKQVFKGLGDGDIITGTRKAQEIVEKPTDYHLQQQSPPIEIIKSEELSVNHAHSNVNAPQPQQFDHANALGRSIGFDYSNAMEGGGPSIYKKYVRPGTLEQKAEHYFNSKQPLRVVHLQGAATGAVPAYERPVAGEGQGGQLGRYEPAQPGPKLPIDTRLLRNPVLLPNPDAPNYKNDPNIIPIHFDTRQLQQTFQKEQQPFTFPDYSASQQQPQISYHKNNNVRIHQQQQPNFDDSNQQQSLRVYSGRVQPLEKRGGFKKELAPIRQPRYTPKVQVQTLLRPPPQLYQRKVLVAKLH